MDTRILQRMSKMCHRILIRFSVFLHANQRRADTGFSQSKGNWVKK